MCEIVEASQSSTQELQEQIDTYREKNRRELAELQRQLQDKGLELEKSRIAAKSLQEEVGWGGTHSYSSLTTPHLTCKQMSSQGSCKRTCFPVLFEIFPEIAATDKRDIYMVERSVTETLQK